MIPGAEPLHSEVREAVSSLDAELLRDAGVLCALRRLSESLTERDRELERVKDGARAASCAKDLFLATMSHELRTPMTLVIGSTQLLLETELDEEQRHAAESVHRAGKVLLGIIDDLLDFTKIGSGKLALVCADFDLYAMVRDVVETLRPQAERKGIELSLTVERNVRRWVKGDAFRLGQVLTNLVANAVKFTDSGSVRVRVEAPRDDSIRCVVTDTGIGIAEHDIPRLFEPFAQGDESTTRRYGGTGLGLAIAQQLVECMHGSIGASGGADGSSFWFQVPLASGSESRVRSSRESPRFWRSISPVPSALGRRRVLLAEDNDTNRALILKSLEPLGCAIETVGTGREAVEAVLDRQYDLVLMDCQMPEMDGYEAAAAIRRIERGGRRIPIVALTANALYGDRERCLAAGMDDYLPKPFSVTDLRHKTKLWLLPEPVPITVAGSNPAIVISEAAVDPRRLAELGEYGGAEFIAELAAIFVGDAERRLREVERAVELGSALDLRRAGHAFKGAASNVGATRLAELAGRLEHADQAGPAVLGLVEELGSELGRVRHELTDGLDTLLARVGLARRA